MTEIMIEAEHIAMRFHLNKNRTSTFKEWVIQRAKKQIQFEDFYALKDVSVQVRKGDILGIIGRNGSGKSTLLKVISGIYVPTKGMIRTKGRIAPMLELGSGFDFDLTGEENVFLNGAILGFDEKFLKNKYDEIIDFSGLRDAVHQPLKTYSSGMVMRLAFSIASLIEPEILIVDEILAVGDEEFQQKSRDRMMKLMYGGATVLMVSHNLDQIESMCSRVIWLNNGLVELEGAPQEVCRAYREYAATL